MGIYSWQLQQRHSFKMSSTMVGLSSPTTLIWWRTAFFTLTVTAFRITSKNSVLYFIVLVDISDNIWHLTRMEICPLLLLSPSAPTRGAAPFWDKSLKTCLVSLCDKFEPIVLEGQLCFSLNLSQSGGKPTKSGKTKGLFLLLDPNQINTTDWWESRRLEERGAIFQGLHPYTCTAHHIWTRILWDKGFQENDWDNKLQAPIEMPCPQQRGMSDSEELGSNSNEMPMYSMGSADWPGPK